MLPIQNMQYKQLLSLICFEQNIQHLGHKVKIASGHTSHSLTLSWYFPHNSLDSFVSNLVYPTIVLFLPLMRTTARHANQDIVLKFSLDIWNSNPIICSRHYVISAWVSRSWNSFAVSKLMSLQMVKVQIYCFNGKDLKRSVRWRVNCRQVKTFSPSSNFRNTVLQFLELCL